VSIQVLLKKNDDLMKKCNNSKNWKKKLLPIDVVYEWHSMIKDFSLWHKQRLLKLNPIFELIQRKIMWLFTIFFKNNSDQLENKVLT
jgi:hypothetical protein